VPAGLLGLAASREIFVCWLAPDQPRVQQIRNATGTDGA